ncbi:ubiquinol oxidase subunit II [Jiella sp. MQZ9-1]|uniref:Ubiquinol oxidase subunit 2 n=1 Tax=Jiella flava TaxID=2816857 RepID=A0A939JSN6_9HYPH|nr:ubiquinol oxidase subunit II [Jiella flava]MBO0663153.1 ubiquinol oxidase subunit II [Jiella flava]MCD2471571.1 ubiquinol oxidase subunit II [Jiella flava]
MRPFRLLAVLSLPLLLSACDSALLFPNGDIAARQRDMLLIATGLMLIVIVPVIVMSLYIPWRYRASNKKADYDADWNHSTKLELVIWTVPLLIIIVLGAVTWVGTHLLDPFRPLDKVTASQQVDLKQDPLEVQVVALNWKWLFIYPQYGVATVNELAAPVNRPIQFDLTADTVMNAFYIPTLAGMVYSMPGMETKLHAVINKPGVYDGFASQYNGAGFSDMSFKFYGQKKGDFEAWINNLKASKKTLDRAAYLDLAKPSQDVPVTYYTSVDKSLFDRVVGMCVPKGKLCMQQIVDINQGKMDAGKTIDVNRLTHNTYDLDAYGHTLEAQGATAPASNYKPHSDELKPDAGSNAGQGSVAPPQLHTN